MSARRRGIPTAMTLRTPARGGPLPQRGAALVIPAIMITTILAFASLVTGRAARNELTGAYYSSDALQALLAAETGLQRAAKRFTSGTACGNAAYTETLNNYPATGINIAITSKTTDFDGVTSFAGTTKCRIEATGVDTANGVSRKVSAIIDTSLVDTVLENLDFSSGTANWTLSGSSVSKSHAGGGENGVAGTCSTSAYSQRVGAVAVTTQGDTSLYFMHYSGAATTYNVSYRRRFLRTGKLGTNQIQFSLADSTPTYTVPAALTVGSTAAYVGNASPTPPYASPTICSTNYSAAANFAIPIAAASVNPMTAFRFLITLNNSAANKEFFLDSLNVSPAAALASGSTHARIRAWRQCLPAIGNCP